MIKGIESDDWYRSENARALNHHIERNIDSLVNGVRTHVAGGDLTGAAQCEGGIQALERLRNDLRPGEDH